MFDKEHFSHPIKRLGLVGLVSIHCHAEYYIACDSNGTLWINFAFLGFQLT